MNKDINFLNYNELHYLSKLVRAQYDFVLNHPDIRLSWALATQESNENEDGKILGRLKQRLNPFYFRNKSNEPIEIAIVNTEFQDEYGVTHVCNGGTVKYHLYFDFNTELDRELDEDVEKMHRAPFESYQVKDDKRNLMARGLILFDGFSDVDAVEHIPQVFSMAGFPFQKTYALFSRTRKLLTMAGITADGRII